jgi:hypothetical protein
VSIATDVKVATLEAVVKTLQVRLQALEQVRTPAPVAVPRNNVLRQAEGARLRGAIREILAAHPDYSAKHVLKALASMDLGRPALPSVRAVQWHIKALRNARPVLRSAHIPH